GVDRVEEVRSGRRLTGSRLPVPGDQAIAPARRRDPDHRIERGLIAAALVWRGAESEDSAVARRQPVTETIGSGRHAHDRRCQLEGPGRTFERGITEVEDAAVGSDQPVPVSTRRGGHPDDWTIQTNAAEGSVELGVTKA